MQTTVAPNHPKQKLLFYVAQDVDEAVRTSVDQLVGKVAASRAWVIGPPRLVDSTIPPAEGSGDEPIETVGGELEIYSALPPADLPLDVDRQHFDEVCVLVEAIKDLSARQGIAFEFELDGIYVGAIEDGEVDRTLKVGLLEGWHKHVANG